MASFVVAVSVRKCSDCVLGRWKRMSAYETSSTVQRMRSMCAVLFGVVLFDAEWSMYAMSAKLVVGMWA
jgi:hypothetical protein